MDSTDEKEIQEEIVGTGEGERGERKLIVNCALFLNLGIQIHEFQIRQAVCFELSFQMNLLNL